MRSSKLKQRRIQLKLLREPCAKCGYANPTVARYCRECGTELIAFCAECGYANSTVASYCRECGTELIGFRKVRPSQPTEPTQGKPEAGTKLTLSIETREPTSANEIMHRARIRMERIMEEADHQVS